MFLRRRLNKFVLSGIVGAALAVAGAAQANAQQSSVDPVESMLNEVEAGLEASAEFLPPEVNQVLDDAFATVKEQAPAVQKQIKEATAQYDLENIQELVDNTEPVSQAERLAAGDPNYQWRNDLSSKVLAGKPEADFVLNRVPGSFHDAPRVPEESWASMAEGKSLYGPGTPIYVEENFCTMAVTGTDEAGRKVGITAGHCGEAGDRVASADSPMIGQSGEVAHKNAALDYAVVELGDNAEITGTYNGVSIENIDGNLQPHQTVCKNGVASGKTCGPVTQPHEVFSAAKICAMQGDSGAPVYVDRRLAGMIMGGTVPLPGAQLLSCRSPLQGELYVPTAITNMDAVLNDINSRGLAGAGFTPAQ